MGINNQAFVKDRRGFTVVELLIVVVVIGILAALVVISYSGVQQGALKAKIQSDLTQATQQLEISKHSSSLDGHYPSNLSSASLKSSPGVNLFYSVDNSSNPATYCLSAATEDGNTAYHVSSVEGTIQDGACAGHDVGGPPVFDNLSWQHLDGVGVPTFGGGSLGASTSSDGNKIFVSSSGNLNLSQDRGQSWTAVGPSLNYTTSDMSDDGEVMIAGTYSGYVYLSTDYGANWTQQGIGSRVWRGVAASGDGQKLLAVTTNVVYMSVDGGANWVSQSSKTGNGSWGFAAISGNGQSMIVGGDSGAGVVMSSDGGDSWSKTISTNRIWSSAAISDDGLTAYVVNRSNSLVSKTTNAGVSWTNIGGANVNGTGVSTSSDGTKVIVVGQGPSGNANAAARSIDSGSNWSIDSLIASSSLLMKGVAVSANGAKVVAIAQTEGLYIGQYGP